ncbi:MAG: RIO1 family regulatory kinase/ATPase [Armatimonas sp.]
MDDSDSLALDDDEEDLAYLDDEDEGAFERFHDPRVLRQKERKRAEAVQTLTDSSEELGAGHEMTYKAARHEKVWLAESLGTFYDQSLLSDVLFLVKGGKEANCYGCEPHPALAEMTGLSRIAAKVYRPRMLRNLRQDFVYRENRTVLTAEGKSVKNSDTRIMKALGKKTTFGAQVAHTSWLMHEFNALGELHAAGAYVPRPLASGENALLMEFIGSEERAAPALSEVALTPTQAREALKQVRMTLGHFKERGWVHGDLSAFNILWHEGRAVFIDFPQVIRLEQNPNAEMILQRDLTRVAEYFQKCGLSEVTPESLWQ